MELWIDEHGMAGLTETNGRQSLFILPEDQVKMEHKVRSLIKQVSTYNREKYNEIGTEQGATGKHC